MEAVHVRTYGMHCGKCTEVVERALSDVDGAIRTAGFEAEIVPPESRDLVAAA